MTEIIQRPLRRSVLESTDSFILSVPGQMFVWIGKEASKMERQKSMLYAQSFLQGKNKPMHTPVVRVVQGSEPAIFTSKFYAWHDTPVVAPLSDAAAPDAASIAVSMAEYDIEARKSSSTAQSVCAHAYGCMSWCHTGGWLRHRGGRLRHREGGRLRHRPECE